MFGWFRKRDDIPALDATPATPQVSPASTSGRHAQPVVAAAPRPEAPRVEQPVGRRVVLDAPSLRPPMPLSDRPNVTGRSMHDAQELPRLLDPVAALGDEAREELTVLLADLFGARGRYRLEWRTDREPGDDAMFAEIMVADLVRRIQNTIADVAELERPAGRLAIAAPAAVVDEEAAPEAAELESAAEVADIAESDDVDATRQRAIDSFLNPVTTTGELVAIASHAVEAPDEASAAEMRTA